MKNEDLRICFIGDSFVHGTNDPECLGWSGRLAVSARHRGYTLTSYNLGVRRETSSDIAKRWLDEARPRLPEFCQPFVVFSFGVNDTAIEDGKVRVAETESVENTRSILYAAKRLYSVVMIGPPPVADADHNLRVRRISALFAAVAEEQGTPFLPVFEALSGDPVWMAEVNRCDGSHPGAEGYARLAAIVEAWPGWWFRQGQA